MTQPNPRNDRVLVVTDEQLQQIADGQTVSFERGGDTYLMARSNAHLRDRDGKTMMVDGTTRSRLRRGEACNWACNWSDEEPVSVIYEDYAGTPKSNEVAAERLFELFKEEEGRARGVAGEALNLLGYEIEKDVEYSLVAKDE